MDWLDYIEPFTLGYRPVSSVSHRVPSPRHTGGHETLRRILVNNMKLRRAFRIWQKEATRDSIVIGNERWVVVD